MKMDLNSFRLRMQNCAPQDREDVKKEGEKSIRSRRRREKEKMK
jgi:hypothetical protein